MDAIDNVFAFDTVQFFGRDMNEYVDMFNLNLDACKGFKILDCPGGPSTFAMEAKARGIDVIACDPMYDRSASALFDTISEQIKSIKEQVTRLAELFDPDKPALDQDARLKLYQTFLGDYENPANKGRYVHASLPSLPFADNSFDLALTGNLLFMYSDVSAGGILSNSTFDYDFHVRSILELMRVAREARFYPLKGANSEELPFFPRLLATLKENGLRTRIEDVPYRDLKNAHQMLKVFR